MRKWLPLTLWGCFIFGTSSKLISRDDFVVAVANHLPASTQSGWDSMWVQYGLLPVKGWHMAEFAILFLLAVRNLQMGFAVGFAMLFAVSDEFHQHFIPGRGGRFTDVLIDWAAIAVAAFALHYFAGKKGLGRSAMPAACSSSSWPYSSSGKCANP